MVRCHRQSGLAHTDAINVAWNCKCTLRIKIAHINCLASNSNIYTGKTPVPDFGAPFAHLFMGEKPYYNGGLFLNESIDLTSIGL